jgi:excisionase family DNA binding protein
MAAVRKRKYKPRVRPVVERLGFRINELVESTGLSRGKIQQLIYNGELPALKLGKVLIVPADVAKEFFNRTMQEAQKSEQQLEVAS